MRNFLFTLVILSIKYLNIQIQSIIVLIIRLDLSSFLFCLEGHSKIMLKENENRTKHAIGGNF